jgi:hypothetical protein
MRGASPDEAQPELHSKPMDAATMVNDFGRKHKTLTKNYF